MVARSAKVAAAWNQLANGSAGEMQRVYDQLAKEPDRDDGDRQHPLEGKTGRDTFEGVDHVRWQIDVSSGGRVWYFIDRTPIGSGQQRRSEPSSSTRSPRAIRRPWRGDRPVSAVPAATDTPSVRRSWVTGHSQASGRYS